jgi:hypothetical protein
LKRYSDRVVVDKGELEEVELVVVEVRSASRPKVNVKVAMSRPIMVKNWTECWYMKSVHVSHAVRNRDIAYDASRKTHSGKMLVRARTTETNGLYFITLRGSMERTKILGLSAKLVIKLVGVYNRSLRIQLGTYNLKEV